MGYDLSGEDRTFRFNAEEWRPLLELACEHGWEPAGTVQNKELDRDRLAAPDRAEEEVNLLLAQMIREWDGPYTGNLWQTVTAEDASNLADALTLALNHINDKERARDFITFCRGGRFQIH